MLADVLILAHQQQLKQYYAATVPQSKNKLNQGDIKPDWNIQCHGGGSLVLLDQIK